jgi:hypothetical protein
MIMALHTLEETASHLSLNVGVVRDVELSAFRKLRSIPELQSLWKTYISECSKSHDDEYRVPGQYKKMMTMLCGSKKKVRELRENAGLPAQEWRWPNIY